MQTAPSKTTFVRYALGALGALLVLAFVNVAAYDPHNELGIFAPRVGATSSSGLDIPELETPGLETPDLETPDLETPDTSQPGTSRSCDVYASAQTIATGSSVTIEWETTGFAKATLNGESVDVSSGSKAFTDVQENTTYRLEAVSADGNSNCIAEVTVVCVPPTVPLPVCEIDAEPAVVTRGDSSTLTWSTTNATQATIDNGIDSVATGDDQTRTVSPYNDTMYTMTVTNSDGESASCATTVEVEEPVVEPDPVCEAFSATPATINEGDSATLTWSVQNETQLAINNGVGVVTDTIEQIVSPLETTTYTLTVFGANDTKVTCPTTVTVTEEPTTPEFPTCPLHPQDDRTIINFTEQRIRTDQGVVNSRTNVVATNVPAGDYRVTLVGWDGYNGRENVAQPNEVWQLTFLDAGDTVGTSSRTTDLNDYVRETFRTEVVNTQLTLSTAATGVRGIHSFYPDSSSANSLFPVCAALDPIEEEPEPEPTCELTVSPSSLPVGGGDVTLAWNTTNADTVSFNQGIGGVATEGGRTEGVTTDRTYTLTATGDGGTVQCDRAVTVEDPDPEPDSFTCEDDVTFTASPDRIDRGDDTELSWDTTDATEVSINQGIGDVSTDGNRTVSPSSDTTYTLTASNGEETISCPTSVDVDSGGGGGGGGSSSPRCELSISDSRIDAGDEIELTWESSRAGDIEITDSDGDVIVTTKDRLFDAKQEVFDGRRTLTPSESTTYTMVAERGSRDDVCTVDVELDDDIIVLEERDQQPLVSGISMSQVPYTGFEAGPILTTLFYAMLTVWALFVSYIISKRRQLATVPHMTDSVRAPFANTPTSEANNDLFPAHYKQPRPVAAATTTTPTQNDASLAATVPSNLPTGTAPVTEPVASAVTTAPVAATATTATGASETVEALETQAHQKRVLVSRYALEQFVEQTTAHDVPEVFDALLDYAAASYPAEHGWVVLNVPRLQTLLQA